jgi:Flp pilus assembly pilin Flp
MKIKNKILLKKLRRLKNLLKEENGQTSAEMILLMGIILVIVIIAGNFIFNISENINNSLKDLLEKERNSILYKI